MKKKKTRSLTKSAVAFAREALATAKIAFKPYSAVHSPRVFTQQQLFAMIALKDFLKTDFRGLITILSEWSDLRKVLKLERLPHYSTLCYARERLLKKGASHFSSLPPSGAPEKQG
jgi:hypothetical protein